MLGPSVERFWMRYVRFRASKKDRSQPQGDEDRTYYPIFEEPVVSPTFMVRPLVPLSAMAETNEEQEPAWARLNRIGHPLDHVPQVAEWDRTADIVHLCRCGNWTTFCHKCDTAAYFPLPPTSSIGTSDRVDPQAKRRGWCHSQESPSGPLAARAVSVWSAESDSDPEFESSHTLAYHGGGTSSYQKRLASRSMCSIKPLLRKSISNMKLHIRKYSV